MLSTSKRIIRAGFLNFKRSPVISLASILVMTITLSVMASLLIFQAVLHSSLEEVKNKADVTIYFNPDTKEDTIFALRDNLENVPEVAEITYVNAEEMLATYKERHKDQPSLLVPLQELDSNPFGGSLNIRAKEISQYESISNYLASDTVTSEYGSSIYNVNYAKNKLLIDRLQALIEGARTLGLGITLVLMAISVIITFNTIRLTIYIAREEIGIMRLVGADTSYVTGPFLIEGTLYGLISSVVVAGLFFPITYWIGGKLSNFLGFDLYSYYFANFGKIFLIILVFGIFLGSLSSFLAVRKYLKT